MNSSYECEQKIFIDGYMESVLCYEVYLFKFFFQGDSGVMIEVIQKLVFVFKFIGIIIKMGMINVDF